MVSVTDTETDCGAHVDEVSSYIDVCATGDLSFSFTRIILTYAVLILVLDCSIF